jgi:hypothetical protein
MTNPRIFFPQDVVGENEFKDFRVLVVRYTLENGLMQSLNGETRVLVGFILFCSSILGCSIVV